MGVLGNQQDAHAVRAMRTKKLSSPEESLCLLCPASRIRKYHWSSKAIRRRTTGTSRMRYLRHVTRRFKVNFREGTQATPRSKGIAATS